MFHARTLPSLRTLLSKAKWSEEPLDFILVATGDLLLLGARSHGHVHHCGRHMGRKGLHGVVKRGNSAYAVVVKGRGRGRNTGGACRRGFKKFIPSKGGR